MTAPATAPAQDKPRRSVTRILGKTLKWALYILLGLVGLIFLTYGFGTWPFEVGWYLAFGWIQFIVKNFATVELNAVLAGEGIVCTIALGVGAHYFCQWLYREAGAPTASPWRWQWTAAGLALVLLLFVSGIGTIGAVHQAAWLFSTKDPLLVDSMPSRARVSEVLLYAHGIRSTVQEYYDSKGRLPQNGEEAGFGRDTAPANRLVSTTEIREQGVVVVTLTKERDWPDGGEITLTPIEDSIAKKLTWKCHSTLPPKLLPRPCRE